MEKLMTPTMTEAHDFQGAGREPHAAIRLRALSLALLSLGGLRLRCP